MAACNETFFVLLFLACFSLVVLPPSLCRITPSSTANQTTPQEPLAALRPNNQPGAIETSGKNYSKVCDPDRFAALRLQMGDFAYCNKSLPYEIRARDLIGRMTLAEKTLQLGDRAQGVDRIGLPKYGWWSEALHGVASTGHATYFGDVVPAATSFPNVILSAASFNESLWKRIGQVVSTEARAMYNLGHTGLNFWSPNINVVRDPRWGRILETPGEDPFVVGRYGVNFVRGMQDVEGTESTEDLNSRPLKVSACCKHYTAYDVDNWLGVDRQGYDARVAEQDMVETFNRPFEMCVKEGDASAIMCSYNRVNGIPMCADANLLTHTIRNDWQLHGYIVSDCDSVEVMKRTKWLSDSAEAAVGHAMKAGLDLDCGLGEENYYRDYGLSAVMKGKMNEPDIDNALKNLYMVLMRVGFFDNIAAYESLGTKDICTDQNIELAADAARQALVLMKNDGTLPLDPKKHTNVALVGPHANATKAMIGNYEGIPCRYTSPLDAISKDVNVDYRQGCAVQCIEGSYGEAVEAAKKASATIVLAGLDLSVEAEGRDRQDLLLPGSQSKFISEVAAAAAGPVVLVILSGGGIDISFAQNSSKIGAIIWAGYPGQEGGQAIADVIFGRYNPGGRLPITWYKADYVDALPMTSMQLRPNDEYGYPGRTYKFFNGDVLYPFGHGLSYNSFKYIPIFSKPGFQISVVINDPTLCKPITLKPDRTPLKCPSISIDQVQYCKADISFDVEVANMGSMGGEHAVLVYSIPPEMIAGAPLRQLVGFQRVFVPATGKTNATFSLNACKALALVGNTAYTVFPAGHHTIQIGDGDSAITFSVHVDLQL